RSWVNSIVLRYRCVEHYVPRGQRKRGRSGPLKAAPRKCSHRGSHLQAFKPVLERALGADRCGMAPRDEPIRTDEHRALSTNPVRGGPAIQDVLEIATRMNAVPLDTEGAGGPAAEWHIGPHAAVRT